MNTFFICVPIASLLALVFAFIFFRQMRKEDEGTPTMRKIAQYVREGAMAYLKQQYKVVIIVFVVLAVFFAILAYGFGVQNPWV
ncbi:MAG: sodium/proton-translocating pyrophosphatase, partial [Bacteroidales bacterium]|nr:sodium/proton-translocating pyrophosphatase [Bacteroidales bacterium]